MYLCLILSRRRWLLALLGVVAMLSAAPAAMAATDPAPTAAEAGQAPLPEMLAEAARATVLSILTASVADTGKIVQDGLSRSKALLDRTTQELIDRTGLDRLGLTPNQAYGITLGALAGALTADALGGHGFATVSLVAVGAYLGHGVATATAAPAPN
jgi:hypothetical protein